MKKLLLVLVILAGFAIPLPAQAENVRITFTAPTSGGLVIGYSLEQNINGVGWTIMTDNLLVTTYDGTQAAGTVVQYRVRAWNYLPTPVVDASGLLVGITQTKRYGIYSDLSIPYVPDPGAPGGCGNINCSTR